MGRSAADNTAAVLRISLSNADCFEVVEEEVRRAQAALREVARCASTLQVAQGAVWQELLRCGPGRSESGGNQITRTPKRKPPGEDRFNSGRVPEPTLALGSCLAPSQLKQMQKD